MIEIKNLSFSYKDKEILKNISFTAQDGECVGILGNNGAGKSTLITCINRLKKPKSGKIFIDNKDISNITRLELAKQIAYVSQKADITESTVFDYILLGRKPYIKWSLKQSDLDLCTKTLENLGLYHLQLRKLNKLSGGELQKIMLTRALVQQPKVLLLDEPTSNLDPKNQYEMMNLVHKIAKEQNITVLIVIHDLNLALHCCDKFYFLKDGKGYSYGDIETVTHETIENVYGITAKVKEFEHRKIVMIG